MQKRFGILSLVAICALAALFAVTRPIETHSVAIDLPAGDGAKVDPVKNKIVITERSEILWNGTPISLDQLAANLKQTAALPKEPELQFEPEPRASYDLSAKVLNAIKDSKVTKFGFVGNEKYSTRRDGN